MKKFLISLGVFFLLFLCGVCIYILIDSWNTPNFPNAVIGSLFIIISPAILAFMFYLFIRFDPMHPGRIKNERTRALVLFILGLLTLAGAFHSDKGHNARRKAYYGLKRNEEMLRNSELAGHNSTTNKHYSYPPITPRSSWDMITAPSKISSE